MTLIALIYLVSQTVFIFIFINFQRNVPKQSYYVLAFQELREKNWKAMEALEKAEKSSVKKSVE